MNIKMRPERSISTPRWGLKDLMFMNMSMTNIPTGQVKRPFKTAI